MQIIIKYRISLKEALLIPSENYLSPADRALLLDISYIGNQNVRTACRTCSKRCTLTLESGKTVEVIETIERNAVALHSIKYSERKLSHDEQVEVARLHREEKISGLELAAKFKVSLSSIKVCRWVRALELSEGYYQKESSPVATDLIMRYTADSQALQRIAIKHWIIREFDLKDRSCQNLVRLIDQIRTKRVSVREACEWLEVSRTSYYRWRSAPEVNNEDQLVT